MEKAVCFVGHREAWYNVGLDQKLEKELNNLIQRGFRVFYIGGKGEFDNVARKVLLRIRQNDDSLKIILVAAYNDIPKDWDCYYTECITPELENVFYKRRIIEKNKWIVDHSDVLICNVTRSYKSGSFLMFRYALKKGLSVINLADIE